MTPRATYRLQFSPSFGFRDAAALAPYLADLGISHVYASPFFAARPGSTHGYDIVDHNRLNPELGSQADFDAMAAALRSRDLGLIADFVPNHMGIGGATNRAWLGVLEWGVASPCADWFDIDWSAAEPGLSGKVLVPFLGAPYGEALADGALDLRFDAAAGTFAVWAHDTHKLPVCPRHYGDILRRAPDLAVLAPGFDVDRAPDDPHWPARQAELAGLTREPAFAAAMATALASYRGHPGDPSNWADLDRLVARQHWRAAKFNLDRDAINYRRFFVISDLAGLKVERPEVFEATHRLVLDLLAQGTIDGLRIDHIDGLLDPASYARHLRARAGRPFYLLVEKILAPDETLPSSWNVDGTTGYEFSNLLVGLLADPAGTEALTAGYHAFTGLTAAPEDVVHRAKLAIMDGAMAAEINALAARFHALAQQDPRTRDLGRHSLRAGIVQVIAGLDVYRTYADADGIGQADLDRIATALDRARRRAPSLDPGLFAFIGSVLTLALPQAPQAGLDCAMRLQQASGPIMAKGLEDTALYRYNRLIALNEVGSEPGRYGVSIADFHAANADRLAREPLAMLATSTHDTKRGEDARMRIAALSGHAAPWLRAIDDWQALADRTGAAPIDRNEAYFFYQLLIGVWPADWRPGRDIPADALDALRSRVTAAMLKSVREAGVNTRWVFGDPAYEAALEAFVARALDPGPDNAFLQAFRAFEARIAADGAANALVQTVLKLTVPGVPDIYQGAEVWEQSLVDPDNRRAVDFPARAALLDDVTGPDARLDMSDWPSGAVKLGIVARLLQLRRRMPRLFSEGSYDPVPVSGPGAGHLCAFLRRGEGETMLVAAALHPAQGDARWTGTRLDLAAARWHGLLDDADLTDPAPAQLFETLPVAVLLARR